MESSKSDDWAEFRVADYRILNNVWGKADHVPAAQFDECRQSIATDPGQGPPINARFDWSWPLVNPHQILAYPEIVIGKKPWDASTSKRLPRRLGTIRSQRVRYRYAVSSTGAFNVAFDCWILRDATSGADGIAAELMVWLEFTGMLPIGVPLDGPPLETADMEFDFWAGERVWPTYTYQCKGTPMREGTLDLGVFLTDLRERRLVGPDLWLGSVEFGSEIIHGTGVLEVGQFVVL